MGFFKRFVGGNSNKNDISEIGATNTIINEGDHNLLMWPHPLEDFNNKTSLIVGQNETALFIKGGAIACCYNDPTPPKGIILATSNYPGLRVITEMLNGGRTRYPCKVIYVNQKAFGPFHWGTPIGIGEIISAQNGIIQNYIGNIEYQIKIINPKNFYNEFGFRIVTKEDLAERITSKIATTLQATLKIALECYGNTPTKWLEILKDEEESEFQELFKAKVNGNKLLKDMGIELYSISPELHMTENGLSMYSLQRNKNIMEMEELAIKGDHYSLLKQNEIQMEIARNSQTAANAMGVVTGLNLGSIIGTPSPTSEGGWNDPWGNNSLQNNNNENKPETYESLDLKRKREQKQILIDSIKELENSRDWLDDDVYKKKLQHYKARLADLL